MTLIHTIIKKPALLLLFLSATLSISGQKIAKKALIDDLQFLHTNLASSSYDLYAHTAKKKFDEYINKARKIQQDSFTNLESWRVLQSFVALGNIGHLSTTYPIYPDYVDYLRSGGGVFPLDVYFDEGATIVVKDYSAKKNAQITPGDKILEMNDKSMDDWLALMYALYQGDNSYYKLNLISQLKFSRMLWLLGYTIENFNLTLQTVDGDIKEVTVKAINGMDFEGKVGNEATNPYKRSLKFYGKTAHLTPGIFLNEGNNESDSTHKNYENESFKKFIDSCFTQIAALKTENLIIDLRDNTGGNDTFSNHLISYFADQPFKFCSRFLVKTSKHTKAFWKGVKDPTLKELRTQILTKKDGEVFEAIIPTQQPLREDHPLKFKGKVFLLINRGTLSNSVSVAAIIKDYKFGVLVGEKTAGSPTNHGATQSFTLPNSKIAISYTKALIVRPSGSTKIDGIQPDILVKDNLFTTKDEVMDHILRMIEKKP